MNIRDYRKFADQFNYNVGDWKCRDNWGNLMNDIYNAFLKKCNKKE